MLEFTGSSYPLTLTDTVSGNAVQELEKSLASYLGYREVIALNSVESAFVIALSTLEKKCGLLCSPNAPLGLFNALVQHGLHAEYCDLRLDGTMETRLFSKSVTARTSALLLSHNHGILSDAERASSFAEEQDIILLEDATQAFGKKKKSGAELVLYSLDALIPASLAGGGFIATDNDALAASLRHKARGGYVQKKFWNYDVLNTDANLTIASLTAQLTVNAMRGINEKEQRVHAIQSIYLKGLSSNRLIELPTVSGLIGAPYFQVALVPALFCPKEDIYKALVDAGIPVKVGNKPVYKTTAFKDEALSLFGAEEVFKAQLLLPAHHLMTLDDAEHVLQTVENVLETYGYRGCSF